MRTKSLTLLVTLLGVGLAACDTPTQPQSDSPEVSASVAGGAQSWADADGSAGLASVAVRPTVQTRFAAEGVSVVAGATSVDGGSALEDFEGANGSGVLVCAGPITVHTNDACYSPEEIFEGLSVDNLNSANDPNGMVAITPAGLGLPSTVVGPNFFTDGTELAFGYGGMNEVYFELYAPFHGPCWLLLEVFDAGGLIGQFAIGTGAGGTPAAYGVFAPGGMTRMTFSQSDPCGELFDNVFLVKY